MIVFNSEYLNCITSDCLISWMLYFVTHKLFKAVTVLFVRDVKLYLIYYNYQV